MYTTRLIDDPQKILIIESENILINDPQDAMDLMISACFEQQVNKVILHKSTISEDFFDLRTGMAGEILQKCTNYHIQLAIVGDFSQYSSKALKDFIYESNEGTQIFFLGTESLAVDALNRV